MTWRPDYLTLAEAKSFLRITDTNDDVELAVWISALSREIDKSCNRQFGNTTGGGSITRTYRRPPVWDPVRCVWVMDIDDLSASAGVTLSIAAATPVTYGTVAAAGAVLFPDNAPLEGVPWTALAWPDRPTWSYYGSPATVTVTANPWGWTAVPAEVPAAARLQLNRLWNRRDSPMGTAGSPSEGSELRLLARLDPDVAKLLKRVRRRRRAG